MTSPARSSCGTKVPAVTMPMPTPANMMPPMRPRRSARMTASTVGATATIRSPPLRPERKRQNTNQGKPSRSAQAKKVAVASSIISRTSRVGRMRLITGRAPMAPMR